MIGLVLAAHGDLAKGFLSAAELIAGKQDSFVVLALEEGMSPEEFRSKIKEGIEEADTGQGVLILADLFGGTPGNIALEFTLQDNVRLVAGINLGLVLEATQMRSFDLSLDELSQQLVPLGKEGIITTSLKP